MKTLILLLAFCASVHAISPAELQQIFGKPLLVEQVTGATRYEHNFEGIAVVAVVEENKAVAMTFTAGREGMETKTAARMLKAIAGPAMNEQSDRERTEWVSTDGAVKADIEPGSPLFLWHAGNQNYRTLCEPWWFTMPKGFTCAVGDFQWGQIYHAAKAVLQDDGGVWVSANEGRVKLKPEQVTLQLIGKFRTAIEVAKKDDPEVRRFFQAEADKKSGIFLLSGKIICRTGDGALIAWGRETVHVRGSFANFVDGDYANARVSPSGTFEYTTVLGAAATVRQYSIAPSAH